MGKVRQQERFFFKRKIFWVTCNRIRAILDQAKEWKNFWCLLFKEKKYYGRKEGVKVLKVFSEQNYPTTPPF